MHFLWFPTCIFILVLFRIQQHIAEPYFKIVSRTAQLRRLQVSFVRFQYVSRNVNAIFLLKLEVTRFFTPNISLGKLLQYCDTLCLFIATVHVNIQFTFGTKNDCTFSTRKSMYSGFTSVKEYMFNPSLLNHSHM